MICHAHQGLRGEDITQLCGKALSLQVKHGNVLLSLYMQAVKGEATDVVRVFLQTPTGSCHVDITRAILQNHLQVC